MENCPRPIIINNKIKWKSNSLLQERRYREARLNRLANAERIKIRKKLRVMGSERERGNEKEGKESKESDFSIRCFRNRRQEERSLAQWRVRDLKMKPRSVNDIRWNR